VGGTVAGWLVALPVLLPGLGRWIRAGHRPAPAPLDAPLPRPQLRLVPDPTS